MQAARPLPIESKENIRSGLIQPRTSKFERRKLVEMGDEVSKLAGWFCVRVASSRGGESCKIFTGQVPDRLQG